MFCLSDSHISDIRHCFNYCNKDYKSESVNESSTTCLSYCYIQTDITAVLPPGWGVLHILLVFYCVVSAKEKIELHVFYAMQCKTLQCCQSVCLVCRWNPV